MSDRKKLFRIDAEKRPNENKSIDLFMDRDSGTWRLFLVPAFVCIDLSLEELRGFYSKLGHVIERIEDDPGNYDAEIRVTGETE